MNLYRNVLLIFFAVLTINSSGRLVAQSRSDSTQDGKVRSTSLILPPHPKEEWGSPVVEFDLVKFILFFHFFWKEALGDHFAFGGAIQTPTTIIDNAVGLGAQPEITYCFRRDPFDGPFVGVSAWLNYVHYTHYITVGSQSVDVGTLSEFPVSIAPTIGFYAEGPVNGPAYQLVVGAEYNIVTTTQSVVGIFSNEKGVHPYVSVRMGYRW